ncbi:putative elongator complex protein 1 [Coemansia sp. Benny D115]|nr:putative elongator complex protein 1 [Coemansia sp. Benny D115]
MRNLTILSEIVVKLAGYRVLGSWQRSAAGEDNINNVREAAAAALCVDMSEQKVYVVVGDDHDTAYLVSVPLESLQNAAGRDIVDIVCTLPFAASTARIAGMQFLMERETVFLALGSGDILTINVGSAAPQVEPVGTVDSGVMSSAWSPDEELLALVTGEAKLLLMTQDFDVMEEFPLAQGEHGEEQHVALGWGKKETQYHGKAGKAAALADTEIKSTTISEFDDYHVRISWRGDGAFFGVTYVGENGREIRTFSREGKLHSIGEKIVALEHTLAWKPSGRLLAATEKQKHRHDVVFYERNGLRHGEFTLRKETRRVLDLAWNSDSSVLAVTSLVDARGDGEYLEPCVELWSDKNYHWYLKQELWSSAFGDEISHVVWDTEDTLCLHVVCRSSYVRVRLHSTPDTAHVASDISNAAACVVDGNQLLYTPFRVANVPPPMALHTLNTTAPIAHTVFASFGSGNNFAALLADRQTVVLFDSQPASTVRDASAPQEKTRVSFSHNHRIRQIAWVDEHTLVGLGTLRDADQASKQIVGVIDVESGSVAISTVDNLVSECPNAIRLAAAPHAQALLLETADGQVFTIRIDGSIISAEPLVHLPAVCVDIDAVRVDGELVVVGRSERNQLFANEHLISSVCSSFFMRSDTLLFTTTTHFVRFVPVGPEMLTVAPVEDAGAVVAKYDESCRRVERGSTIVLASPVGESVVFQMPRGNLETVRPRALVLSTVRRFLDERRYRDALVACRVNRIDMNIIYDHNPEMLSQNYVDFVNQINDPDMLNLFVSSLRDEDVTRTMYTGLLHTKDAAAEQNDANAKEASEGKTTNVCQSLRPVLQATGDSKYMPTILTTFVCQIPADIPAALELLAPLSTEECDAALTYLLFLSDVDTVYNAALGLYNLPLALLVAQRSQRDPREYLAALGTLNALPNEEYRRFKIDAQLNRNSKALAHLCTAYEQMSNDKESESEMWNELAAYVQETEQYEQAIQLLSNNQRRFRNMCELYGDFQAAKNNSTEWAQAAVSYVLGGAQAKSVNAFVQAQQWRSAMSIVSAPGSGYSLQAIHDTAVNASTVLTEHHKFKDAARVLLEYTEKDEEAIALFVRGNHWAEAVGSALLHERSDLIETTIRPALIAAHESISDDITEISDTFALRLGRLIQVRSKPLELIVERQIALATAGADGPISDNIDVMSDTTSMASKFSSFTGTVTNASSRMTGSTARRISKNKRKEERRKVRGKKDSIYEESYLVDSISKLVDRVRVHQTDVRNINLLLIQFGQLRMATELQDKFSRLVNSILENAEFVFDQQRVQMRLGENGIPEPMPLDVNEFGVTSQPKHPKPKMPTFEWRIDALQLK